ncbi:MAG: membrane-targeted effector domain-containing toxin [Chlamydiales bacterium]|nr:membrane-targeted effector domain-containing toxin [Chlamydiales bacterium]
MNLQPDSPQQTSGYALKAFVDQKLPGEVGTSKVLLKLVNGQLKPISANAHGLIEGFQRFFGRLGFGPYSLQKVATHVLQLAKDPGCTTTLQDGLNLLRDKIIKHNQRSSPIFHVKIADLAMGIVTSTKIERTSIDPEIDKPFLVAFEQAHKSDEGFKKIRTVLQDAGIGFTCDAQQQTFTFHHEIREVIAIIQAFGLTNEFRPSKDLTLMANPIMVTMHNLVPGKFQVKDGASEAFKDRMDTLLQNARTWVTEQNVEQIQIKQEVSDPKALLDEHDGIIFGENHKDNAARKYLVENMAEMKEKGVDTLFFEHICYDTFQTYLDAYFESESDELTEPLKQFIANIEQPGSPKEYCFKDVIVAAKKANIRIVAIDTSVSYSCGVDRKLGVVNSEERNIAMNYVATKIIEREKKGKYIALMGSSHVASRYANIPGVAELLHQPSVVMETSRDENQTAPKIQRNIKDLHGEISHVGLYIQQPPSY